MEKSLRISSILAKKASSARRIRPPEGKLSPLVLDSEPGQRLKGRKGQAPDLTGRPRQRGARSDAVRELAEGRRSFAAGLASLPAFGAARAAGVAANRSVVRRTAPQAAAEPAQPAFAAASA